MDSFFERHLTVPASETYDTITFKTDKLYNRPAPEPWIAFMIGGILGVVAVGMWCWRYRNLYKRIEDKSKLTTKAKIRMALSAWLDYDCTRFTIAKMGFYAFTFLGGFQLNYSTTLFAMLAWFALESVADAARVLIAFCEVDDLNDFVPVTQAEKREIKQNHHAKKIVLQPANVYEDLSRSRDIVFMIFALQAMMIAFVTTDIFNTETHSCHDGTKGCPVVGTLGSWCFYIVGTFMSIVYLLGPKNNFGGSEQNPAFWIQLLLAANGKDQSVVTCKWFDPKKDEEVSCKLLYGDWRIWVRFTLSFLMNGVGFHILVHALPIQVAYQSSLTGVVIRAVGMMYLVDLDDSKGLTLNITDDRNDSTESTEASSASDDKNKEQSLPRAPQLATDVSFQAEMQKIIQQARADMEALALAHGVVAVDKATSRADMEAPTLGHGVAIAEK